MKKNFLCVVKGFVSLIIIGTLFCLALPTAATGYVQTNIVSDIPGLAANTDLNLKNPWGITYGPSTPFWVSDNATGVATLYNGAGTPNALVVTIPPKPGSPPGSKGTPTGAVFNGISGNFTGDRFIFATEDGTIAGWQGSLGTTAAIRVDNSGAGAVYKGLALAGNLYAANFSQARIDIFDSDYKLVSISGAFTDPNLPSGYVPFNVQNIGGSLLVAYAVANGDEEVAGAGLGIVDKFDLNGNLLQRLISNGGPLNAPWGLATAPGNFGEFGGDLLVGNFGDGRINAFDPDTGAFLGTLKDSLGKDLINEGLWGLIFGNGGAGGDPNKLYFTAGLNDEANGLFGSIAVPLPPAVMLFGSGLAGLLIVVRIRRKQF